MRSNHLIMNKENMVIDEWHKIICNPMTSHMILECGNGIYIIDRLYIT